LACQLLRVFFSDEELANGKLSERGGGDYTLLDPHIVNVIKAYCSSTTFKPEQKIKEGHKKGIAHAMTLSIKQLRRRALKKARESSNNKVATEVEPHVSKSIIDYNYLCLLILI